MTRRASGIAVSNEASRSYSERLLAGPVALDGLAFSFAESSASAVDVLVEGEVFYPRMLADIESATSSVHINQFGFRPGVVGDVFARQPRPNSVSRGPVVSPCAELRDKSLPMPARARSPARVPPV